MRGDGGWGMFNVQALIRICFPAAIRFYYCAENKIVNFEMEGFLIIILHVL